MVVPKYVQSVMARARFDFDVPGCNPGYSIRVIKESPYTKIGTFARSWSACFPGPGGITRMPKSRNARRKRTIAGSLQ